MNNASANHVIGPFLLNNDAEYCQTVVVITPGEQPDTYAESKFVARFRHIEPEQRSARFEQYSQAWLAAERLREKRLRGEDLTEDEQKIVEITPPAELAMLRDALVRIESGICVKRGDELEDISAAPTTREAVLRNQWARQAIFRAYLNSLKDRTQTGN